MTLSLEQKTSLDQAVSTFQKQLDRDAAAQDYLRRRGFSPDLASTYRLGVVPADIPGYEQYTGRLAIPYLTPTGVVDVRFRALDDSSQPKYMSRTGTHGHLYNVGAFAVDTDVIAICEGEIDTMTADGMCEIPCVGLPGANAWKPWMGRAFADYARVVILCDGDEPGRELGKRIRKDVEEAIPVHLPDGEDVNSLFLKAGKGELRRRAGL